MKKYLCIGGYVYSADGDRHLISPHRLPRLYGVPPSECVFVANNADMRGFRDHGLMELRPRSNGNYNLIHSDTEG